MRKPRGGHAVSRGSTRIRQWPFWTVCTVNDLWCFLFKPGPACPCTNPLFFHPSSWIETSRRATMTESKQERTVTVAWDPKSPATLLIPLDESAASSSPGGAGNKGGLQMNSFLSHDGVGCNPEEISALMELLDARDIYLGERSTSNDKHDASALRSLSQSYRKALTECVNRWEESLDGNNVSDAENLELLKTANAITNLSEIFLLTPSNDMMMDYYQSTSNLPGAVTADTVRYLRRHHMEEADSFLKDEEYEELNNSMQPEQVGGGDGTLFWKLIENYVVRGCLEDAWAYLSRHSSYRRTRDDTYQSLDSYQKTRLAEDRAGFEALRAILVSAPLPGGRTDSLDSVFGGEFPSPENSDEEFLEGIPSTAYRLWESGSKDDAGSSNKGDFPMTFQPHAASQMYNMWQQTVKTNPEVNQLKRRIPQLQRIVALLSGDFGQIEFDSWTEELCTELLYKKPGLRLSDIHVRTQSIMKRYPASQDVGSLDDAILSIMKGHSTRVIDVMNQLGAGSGAALPAVMTCLLCQLLHDARMMLEPDENYSLKSELLLNAAFAVRSSFATEGHFELGTRLTVRLLVPYIRSDDDVEIAAALANTLEHHAPQSDPDADTILSLCWKLVERKNVRVLDGCVSIIIARHRYYLSTNRPGGAVYWLLKGIQFEGTVLCGPPQTGGWQEAMSPGVCYRLLVGYFHETARSLLRCLLGDEEVGAADMVSGAKDMVTAAQEEPEITSIIPEVKVLDHFVTMALAIRSQKDPSLVASSIVACLEERANNDEECGVVLALARPSMYWNLLRLAKGVLDKNAQLDRLHEQQSYNAPFDVRGMQVLMERFTTIVASREIEKAKPLSEDDATKMRLALADGLMRAFVAENASKKDTFRTGRKVSVDGIYSSDLVNHSREKQEMVVQNMLDF